MDKTSWTFCTLWQHRIDKALIEKFKHKPTLEDLEDYEDLPEAKLVPEEILGEDYDEPIPHSRSLQIGFAQ